MNRDGFVQQPDERLLALLRSSADIARLTDGAFDITVQPYLRRWVEAHDRQSAPSTDELADDGTHVGYRNVAIEAAAIRLAKPGMAITLNGIAQGFATDRVLAVLQRHGIEHALLDTGEIGATGSNGARAWSFAIAHPRHPGELVGIVGPLSGFLATSGDYATTFSPDFRDNHIFDPATGRSPTELASATILAPTGTLADGLSTAAMVMGVERSLSLASRLPNVAAILVQKNGKIVASPGVAFHPIT